MKERRKTKVVTVLKSHPFTWTIKNQTRRKEEKEKMLIFRQLLSSRQIFLSLARSLNSSLTKWGRALAPHEREIFFPCFFGGKSLWSGVDDNLWPRVTSREKPRSLCCKMCQNFLLSPQMKFYRCLFLPVSKIFYFFLPKNIFLSEKKKERNRKDSEKKTQAQHFKLFFSF